MFKYINCFQCSFTSKNKRQFALLKCFDIICQKCAVKGNEPNTIYCPFCKENIKFIRLSDELIQTHPMFAIEELKKDLKQKLNHLNGGTKTAELLVEKLADDETKLREQFMKVKALKKLATKRSEVAQSMYQFRVKIRKQLLQKQYEEKKKAAETQNK